MPETIDSLKAMEKQMSEHAARAPGAPLTYIDGLKACLKIAGGWVDPGRPISERTTVAQAISADIEFEIALEENHGPTVPQ